MLDRHYLPALARGGPFELTGNELHHIVHVMRLQPGGRILVFDGQGHEAEAEIVTVNRRKATLRILRLREEPPSSEREVILATAVPKSERFRWLVEKATELGITRLIPLQTARSVVDPRLGKLERMRQIVVEACKQSGRNWLMAIEPTMDWAAFASTVAKGGETLIADPGGEPAAADAVSQTNRPLVLVVGPEGGWAEEELRQARGAGARCVALGPNILRIETAALAMAIRFGVRLPGAHLSGARCDHRAAFSPEQRNPPSLPTGPPAQKAVSLSEFIGLVGTNHESLADEDEEHAFAERFSATVKNPENRERLRLALAQYTDPEAFEAVLYRCKIAHDWFRYRDEQNVRRLKSWLEERGIPYQDDLPQNNG
jgi:16S rRNA (uracil1498-N3)-methyltransferase